MKKKINIYIPIEVFFREFNSKITFAHEALKKNYRVYIGSKEMIFRLLEKKGQKGGIFFYKENLNNLETIKISKKCDHAVSLDEELGPGSINIDYGIRNRSKNLDELSIYFAFNKIIKKKILKLNKKLKVIVSSHLRYDLYHKKYLPIFKDEVDTIKKKYNKYYLFSSNFGVIKSEHLDDLKKKYKNYKSKDYKKILDYRKKSIMDFENIYKFLKEIQLNHDEQIIFRPHPGDRHHKDIIKKFKSINKVKVIYDYDIVSWIIGCKALIHRGCSTAIDATILNKPVYYIIPKRKLTDLDKRLPYKISNKIDDIENFKNKSTKLKKKFKFLNDLNLNFKKGSINTVLSELKKLSVKKEPKVRFNIINEFIFMIMKFLLFYKRKIRFMYFNDLYFQKNPINLNKSSIRKKLINLDKNFSKKIEINKINFNLFELDKK